MNNIQYLLRLLPFLLSIISTSSLSLQATPPLDQPGDNNTEKQKKEIKDNSNSPSEKETPIEDFDWEDDQKTESTTTMFKTIFGGILYRSSSLILDPIRYGFKKKIEFTKDSKEKKHIQYYLNKLNSFTPVIEKHPKTVIQKIQYIKAQFQNAYYPSLELKMQILPRIYNLYIYFPHLKDRLLALEKLWSYYQYEEHNQAHAILSLLYLIEVLPNKIFLNANVPSADLLPHMQNAYKKVVGENFMKPPESNQLHEEVELTLQELVYQNLNNVQDKRLDDVMKKFEAKANREDPATKMVEETLIRGWLATQNPPIGVICDLFEILHDLPNSKSCLYKGNMNTLIQRLYQYAFNYYFKDETLHLLDKEDRRDLSPYLLAQLPTSPSSSCKLFYHGLPMLMAEEKQKVHVRYLVGLLQDYQLPFDTLQANIKHTTEPSSYFHGEITPLPSPLFVKGLAPLLQNIVLDILFAETQKKLNTFQQGFLKKIWQYKRSLHQQIGLLKKLFPPQGEYIRTPKNNPSRPIIDQLILLEASGIKWETVAELMYMEPIENWRKAFQVLLDKQLHGKTYEFSPEEINQLIARSAIENNISNIKVSILEEWSQKIDEALQTAPEGSEKIINDWSKDNLKKWRRSYQNKIKSGKMSPYILLAMIERAVYLCEGFKPRHVQRMSVVTFLIAHQERTKSKGVLEQIKTGEGKSVTLAMLGSFFAVQGIKVDIITTSSTLSVPENRRKQPFYKLLGLTSNENSNVNDNNCQDIYNSHIIYGTPKSFQGDILQEEFYGYTDYRGKRKTQESILLIDEVDSMLVDGRSHCTYLSEQTPGANHLDNLLLFIWKEVCRTNQHIIEDGKDSLVYIASEFIQTDKGIHIPEYAQEGDAIKPIKNRAKAIEELVNEKLTKALQPMQPNELRDFLLFQDLLSQIQEEQNKLHYLPDNQQDEKKNIEDQIKILEEKLKEHPYQIQKQQDPEENHLIRVPQYFLAHIQQQQASWIKNAVNALLIYKKDKHYVIVEDKIVPIDDRHTGVLRYQVTWSKGLSQFLAIKHGLPMVSYNIVTNFLSNVALFKRYKKIYGVSGTLGTEDEQAFFQDIYDVNTVIIPPYITRSIPNVKNTPFLCRELPTIFKPDRKEYNLAIVEEARLHVDQERAILIICRYIDCVKECEEFIKSADFEANIHCYTGETTFNYKNLKARDIIIATNIAGRGEDFKTSRDIEKNGGLHVCLTFLPENLRIERQNIGRTCRKDNKGSFRLILNQEKSDINMLREIRKYKHAQQMKWARQEVKKMVFKDHLFQRFCTYSKKVYPSKETFARQEVIKMISLVKKINESDTAQTNHDDEKDNSDDDDSDDNSPSDDIDNQSSRIGKNIHKIDNLLSDFSTNTNKNDFNYPFNGSSIKKGIEAEWGMFIAQVDEWLETKGEQKTKKYFQNFVENTFLNLIKGNPVKNGYYYLHEGNNRRDSYDYKEAIKYYDKAICSDNLFLLYAYYNKAWAMLKEANIEHSEAEVHPQVVTLLQELRKIIKYYHLPASSYFFSTIRSLEKEQTLSYKIPYYHLLQVLTQNIDITIEKLQKEARENFTWGVGQVVPLTKIFQEVFEGKDETKAAQYRKIIDQEEKNGLTHLFWVEEVTRKTYHQRLAIVAIATTEMAAAIIIAKYNTSNPHRWEHAKILVQRSVSNFWEAYCNCPKPNRTIGKLILNEVINLGLSFGSYHLSVYLGYEPTLYDSVLGLKSAFAIEVGQHLASQLLSSLARSCIINPLANLMMAKFTPMTARRISEKLQESRLIATLFDLQLRYQEDGWHSILMESITKLIENYQRSFMARNVYDHVQTLFVESENVDQAISENIDYLVNVAFQRSQQVISFLSSDAQRQDRYHYQHNDSQRSQFSGGYNKVHNLLYWANFAGQTLQGLYCLLAFEKNFCKELEHILEKKYAGTLTRQLKEHRKWTNHPILDALKKEDRSNQSVSNVQLDNDECKDDIDQDQLLSDEFKEPLRQNQLNESTQDLNTQILEAARQRNPIDQFVNLYRKGGSLKVTDARGNGLLHIVLQHQPNAHTLRWLTEVGGLSLNQFNHANQTPLQLAREFGHQESIKYLEKESDYQQRLSKKYEQVGIIMADIVAQQINQQVQEKLIMPFVQIGVNKVVQTGVGHLVNHIKTKNLIGRIIIPKDSPLTREKIRKLVKDGKLKVSYAEIKHGKEEIIIYYVRGKDNKYYPTLEVEEVISENFLYSQEEQKEYKETQKKRYINQYKDSSGNKTKQNLLKKYLNEVEENSKNHELHRHKNRKAYWSFKAKKEAIIELSEEGKEIKLFGVNHRIDDLKNSHKDIKIDQAASSKIKEEFKAESKQAQRLVNILTSKNKLTPEQTTLLILIGNKSSQYEYFLEEIRDSIEDDARHSGYNQYFTKKEVDDFDEKNYQIGKKARAWLGKLEPRDYDTIKEIDQKRNEKLLKRIKISKKYGTTQYELTIGKNKEGKPIKKVSDNRDEILFIASKMDRDNFRTQQKKKRIMSQEWKKKIKEKGLESKAWERHNFLDEEVNKIYKEADRLKGKVYGVEHENLLLKAAALVPIVKETTAKAKIGMDDETCTALDLLPTILRSKINFLQQENHLAYSFDEKEWVNQAKIIKVTNQLVEEKRKQGNHFKKEEALKLNIQKLTAINKVNKKGYQYYVSPDFARKNNINNQQLRNNIEAINDIMKEERRISGKASDQPTISLWERVKAFSWKGMGKTVKGLWGLGKGVAKTGGLLLLKEADPSGLLHTSNAVINKLLDKEEDRSIEEIKQATTKDLEHEWSKPVKGVVNSLYYFFFGLPPTEKQKYYSRKIKYLEDTEREILHYEQPETYAQYQKEKILGRYETVGYITGELVTLFAPTIISKVATLKRIGIATKSMEALGATTKVVAEYKSIISVSCSIAREEALLSFFAKNVDLLRELHQANKLSQVCKAAELAHLAEDIAGVVEIVGQLNPEAYLIANNRLKNIAQVGRMTGSCIQEYNTIIKIVCAQTRQNKLITFLGKRHQLFQQLVQSGKIKSLCETAQLRHLAKDIPRLQKLVNAYKSQGLFACELSQVPSSLHQYEKAIKVLQGNFKQIQEIAQSKEFRKAFPHIKPSDITRNLWELKDPKARGCIIEKMVGQNLGQNYPCIDYFNETTKHAASIKSLDLNAKTYQKMSQLKSRISSYINHLSEFKLIHYGNDPFEGIQILSRELKLVLPHLGKEGPATKILLYAMQHAEKKGVTLTLITL